MEDSSTFALPDELQAVWKGCGGKTAGTLSAFKIQVRWDLCTGGFKGLALQDGKTPDSKSALKERRRCVRGVRDADLGYFDTAQFQQEEEAGEYFLSRYKAGNLKLFLNCSLNSGSNMATPISRAASNPGMCCATFMPSCSDCSSCIGS